MEWLDTTSEITNNPSKNLAIIFKAFSLPFYMEGNSIFIHDLLGSTTV